MSISAIDQIRGEAAFINVDGVRTLNYEFSVSIEIVEGGEGKWIQIANITDAGSYAGLNQNQANLTEETMQKLMDCIKKVLRQFKQESLEGKWGS